MHVFYLPLPPLPPLPCLPTLHIWPKLFTPTSDFSHLFTERARIICAMGDDDDDRRLRHPPLPLYETASSANCSEGFPLKNRVGNFANPSVGEGGRGGKGCNATPPPPLLLRPARCSSPEKLWLPKKEGLCPRSDFHCRLCFLYNLFKRCVSPNR